MGLANLFSTILDIEPRLFQPIEQQSEHSVWGRLLFETTAA
jgi:hypothetical protein